MAASRPLAPRRVSSVAERPPLDCALCYAPRWNDHTVRWLPLRGPDRLPYCADTCASYIGAPSRGDLEVWAAMHDKDAEWFA